MEYSPKILSSHGTFIGFDIEKKAFLALRCADDVRLARFRMEGNRAVLFVENSIGTRYYIIPGINAHAVVERISDVFDWFDVIYQSNSFAYFHKNGVYLSVHPDGSVDLQIYRESHELMGLVYADSIVAMMLGEDWFVHSEASLVKKNQIEFLPNFYIKIGNIVVSLEDIYRYAFLDGDKTIFLVYEKYKVEKISLFRPLFYFCAFGKDASFEILKICLESFEKNGNYSGKYIIITDRNEREILRYLSFICINRLKIINISIYDEIDMVNARFRIHDFEEFSYYQPIIYSDFDIICNCDLSELCLVPLKVGNQIIAKSEGLLDSKSYGSTLIEGDSNAKKQKTHGFNSGVLAFQNLEVARSAFKVILASVYSNINCGTNRHSAEVYDQPAANYVLNKLFNFNISELESFVHLWPPVDNGEISGEGLIHFCGGVGAAHKLQRVASYADYISKVRDGDDNTGNS